MCTADGHAHDTQARLVLTRTRPWPLVLTRNRPWPVAGCAAKRRGIRATLWRLASLGITSQRRLVARAVWLWLHTGAWRAGPRRSVKRV